MKVLDIVFSCNGRIGIFGRLGIVCFIWKKPGPIIFIRCLQVPPSRGSYNNLINACGSSGQLEKALEVCQRMTDNGVGPDLVTHNIILSAFKSAGQPQKAVEYYDHLLSKNVPLDRCSHNIILNCLGKMQQFDDAIDLFCRMRKMKGSEPDVITYNSLIHVYAVCGQVEQAQATFEMMLGEIQTCPAFSTMFCSDNENCTDLSTCLGLMVYDFKP
jgi:pentatricopeptide repeat protein